MDHPVRCVHGLSSAHQSYWSDYWLPEGGALGIRPTADVELARYRPECSSVGDRCWSPCLDLNA